MSDPSAPRRSLVRAMLAWRERVPLVLRQRAYLVLAVAAAGVVAGRGERAPEWRHVLEYVAFAAVSLCAAWWAPLLAVSAALGAAWLGVSRFPSRVPVVVQLLVIFLNRQLGHIEGLLAWVVVALAFVPWLWLKLALAAAVVMLGPLAVDHVVLRLGRAQPGEWDHYFARRPAIYAVTALGFLLLFVLAWSQRAELGPLAGAVGAGIVLRVATVLVLRRPARRRAPRHEEVEAKTVEWARLLDRAVALAALGGVLAILVVSVARTESARQRDFARRWRTYLAVGRVDTERKDAAPVMDSRAAAAARVAALGPAPERVDLALFLVADTQLHELRGERVGSHLDLVDAHVPVSVRPVELDLLSGATLTQFAAMYQGLRKDRPAGAPPLYWAHLGDLADVGCLGEIDRARAHLKQFGRGLAALVPGNHDTTFVGNFAWHPDWERACRVPGAAPGEQLMARKADVGVRLHEMEAEMEPKVWLGPFPHWWMKRLGVEKTVLVQVDTLGRHRDRQVVGVFLDTTDYTGGVLGIAGMQGGISSRQRDAVLDQLALHSDAYAILFMHHTFEELSLLARGHVRDIARASGGRVLAVVAAHTHVGALRAVDLGQGRPVPELIVPSTTDPPQEAALLQLGVTASGHSALRMTTIPAVARQGTTCRGAASGVSDARCAGVIAELRARCPDLFLDAGPIVEGRHPPTPAEVKKGQQERARRLLACIYSHPSAPAAKPVPPRPLDDPKLFDALDAFVLDPAGAARREELVCLGWAASVLQRFKHAGWGYPQALAWGFGAAAVQPATEMAFDVDTGEGGARACTE